MAQPNTANPKPKRTRSRRPGTIIRRDPVRGPGMYKWRVRAYVGRDATGKPTYVYAPQVVGTRRDAEDALQKLLAEVNATTADSEVSTRMTMDQLWELYSRRVLPNKSSTTCTGYRSKWRAYIQPAIGHLTIAQVTTAHLEDLYNTLKHERGLAEWTVRRCHTVISAMLTAAARWGDWSPNHVARRCNAPSQPTRTRPLSPAPSAVAALLSDRTGGLLTQLFVRIEAITGLRRGEASALRWMDIDFEHAALSPEMAAREFDPEDQRTREERGVTGRAIRLTVEPISKSERREWIHIGAETLDLVGQVRAEQEAESDKLSQHTGTSLRLRPGDFIFRSDLTGTLPDSPQMWSKRFAELGERLGLDIRQHDLRHFVGTHITREYGLPEAQRVLRHSRVTTTQIYAAPLVATTADQMSQVIDSGEQGEGDSW